MSIENKNTMTNEIVNVYKNIRNFLLGNEKQLEKISDIEGKKEVAERVGGVAIGVAKCLLDIFSLGLASSLLEGTKDVVSSIRGSKNEIDELSKIYDSIAKKYNRQYKKDIKDGTKKKLETTDEMLNEICEKYGTNKRKFKKLKGTIAEHFNMIVSKENEERLNEAEERLNRFDEKLKKLEEALAETKKLQNNKKKQAQIKSQSLNYKSADDSSISVESLKKGCLTLTRANWLANKLLHNNKQLSSHSVTC